VTRRRSSYRSIASLQRDNRVCRACIEAGYPLPLAERIAQSDADLHRAVELIDQGCTHKTAAEILL
jgi:hypothetical protein